MLPSLGYLRPQSLSPFFFVVVESPLNTSLPFHFFQITRGLAIMVPSHQQLM